MTSYEVHYFRSTGRGDFARLMLEFAGAKYENRFETDWAAHKEEMRFGHLPRLFVHEADGTTKVVYETRAIVNYLAEVLDLAPSPGDAFARAEGLSVVSSFCEMKDKIKTASDKPSAAERRAEHEKHWTTTIPSIFKYHERLVQGPYYFGDKVTVADLKLYQTYLRQKEMYGDDSPFETLTTIPKLKKIVEALDAGPAGDYARNRRVIGTFKWIKDEWKWGTA